MNAAVAYNIFSFSISRKSVHVRRLVAAGLKVGVVNQTETAAIKQHKKKEGKGKSGVNDKVTLVIHSAH